MPFVLAADYDGRKMKKQIATALVAVLLAASPVSAQTSDQLFADALSAHKAGQLSTAATIFRRLADSVHGDAQYNLAVLYYNGEGVLQSDRAAYYWAWMSRFYGVSEASVIVNLLEKKLTREAKYETADKLITDLNLRIERGDLQAMLGIARVYEELAEEQDVQAAYTWRVIAAAMGAKGATLLRDATALMLTSQQRMDGQAEAAKIFADWCEKVGDEAPACNGKLVEE